MKPSSYSHIKVLVAVLLSGAVSEAGHPSFCQIWQADILKSEASVEVSRNYKGLWISEKCEIHPGPHFILRRYHISRSGHFNLVRYHYLDPWCTAPDFSVTAVGNFVPSPEKATTSSASWVVPGGIELDYSLRKVTLVPFTSASARRLSQSVNDSCPGAVVANWKPFKKYKVLSYEGHGVGKVNHRLDAGSKADTDCTKGLDFNFNELQLMRLEHRTPLTFLHYRQRIDGGPSDTAQRYHSYLYSGAKGFPKGSRPTYYQAPLLPAQVVHCPTCRSVSKSNAISPPVLAATYTIDPPPSGLSGQWISLRCEVRPHGLFLRRTFIFGGSTEDKSNHWQAQHSYYKDSNCNSPMFTLGARGVYHSGQPSEAVPDATEYDFHIAEAFITPEDVQFANNLNGLMSCGSVGKWRVGTMGNLTGSGGCRELGIAVPSVELDLIRFEKEDSGVLFLYLGETTENQERATSFQPPLVRCSGADEAATNADDYFLNFNELQPLPLTSRSKAANGPQNHAFGFLFWYLMVNYVYYILR